MNNRELFEEGRYAEVIASYSPSSSAQDAFLAISSYLGLGKGQEALTLLTSRRADLWKENPTLTLKANFEIRFILRQFDEAYEDLEYFSNLPYVSQAVEEVLRELPKTIRANELASKGHSDSISEDELLDCLENPKDPYACLAALSQIGKRDITPYLDALRKILAEDYPNDVKTFALLLLASKEAKGEYLFVKNGERLNLEPAKLGSPYETKEYQAVVASISKASDNVSEVDVARGLLDRYCLALYPHRFVNAQEEEKLASDLLLLAKRYLGESLPKEQEEKVAYLEAVLKNEGTLE